MRRQAALRALVCLVLTVATLGVLEGGARLLRKPSAAELDWLEFVGDRGWRSRPGSRSHAFAAEREFDRDGFFTLDSGGLTPEGRRGRRLVLLIGDSRTFGNGVPAAETFGEQLERRRPELDVINRAFPGYSSRQGLVVLESDAPRLRPDVVVFAFDFNDRRYVLRPDDVDGPEHYRRLARLAAWDRLARSLAIVQLAAGRRAPGPDHADERPLDLATVRPRVAPPDFRVNLESAARYAAGHGFALIFLILDDNPAESGEMEAGTRALRTGRLAEAETILRAAVASGNVFSEAARLQLAALYTRTGRADEAARVRISPRTFHSLTGGYPIVPGDDYRAIIREVGARAGVPVVDAGAEIDRHPKRYFDFCHFDVNGHRVVADLLAAALR